MKRFIRLSLSGDRGVYVRADDIIAVRPRSGGKCVVRAVGGIYVVLRPAVDLVAALEGMFPAD